MNMQTIRGPATKLQKSKSNSSIQLMHNCFFCTLRQNYQQFNHNSQSEKNELSREYSLTLIQKVDQTFQLKRNIPRCCTLKRISSWRYDKYSCSKFFNVLSLHDLLLLRYPDDQCKFNRVSQTYSVFVMRTSHVQLFNQPQRDVYLPKKKQISPLGKIIITYEGTKSVEEQPWFVSRILMYVVSFMHKQLS